jgi:hypothetical protein
MGDKRDKVRSTAESALFYVGIPAALVYPLGVVGVWASSSGSPHHGCQERGGLNF